MDLLSLELTTTHILCLKTEGCLQAGLRCDGLWKLWSGLRVWKPCFWTQAFLLGWSRHTPVRPQPKAKQKTKAGKFSPSLKHFRAALNNVYLNSRYMQKKGPNPKTSPKDHCFTRFWGPHLKPIGVPAMIRVYEPWDMLLGTNLSVYLSFHLYVYIYVCKYIYIYIHTHTSHSPKKR